MIAAVLLVVILGLSWLIGIKTGWIGGLPVISRLVLEGESLMSFSLGGRGERVLLALSTDRGKIMAVDLSGRTLWETAVGAGRSEEWAVIVPRYGVSDDGELIATGSIYSPTSGKRAQSKTYCYDRSGRLLWKKEFARAASLPLVAPAGDRVVLWVDSRELMVYGRDGKLLGRPVISGSDISDVAFAAQAGSMAVLSRKGVMILSDGRRVERRIARQGAAYEQIQLTSDGSRFLVSGGPWIELWDAVRGVLLKRFPGERANLALFCSGDAALLMGFSLEHPKGKMMCYGMAQDAVLWEIDVFPPVPTYVDIDRSGAWFVMGRTSDEKEGEKRVVLMDQRGRKRWSADAAREDAWPKISPDGSVIAVVADERTITFYRNRK